MPTPSLTHRLPRLQELGLLIVIAILYLALTLAGFHFKNPNDFNGFLNLNNQFNIIATSMSVYAIMAIGMTCVIIAGGIDISVGAILGLAALAGATVLQYLDPASPWYVSVPVAFFVPVLVGLLCGLANGLMIVGLRIHPFIITLGTLSIYRGLAVVLFPASIPWGNREFPHSFFRVTNYGINVGHGAQLRLAPTISMLAVVILGGVFLHAMVAGRETYAVGGNAQAARYSGIRVWWVNLRVYLIMGLCAGIAAFVHLGRFYAAATNDGQGDELRVIAAAVVGGASLVGGRGTALGALLGAWIIYLIINGIVIMQFNRQSEPIVIGAAIILAATIDRLTDHLRSRRTQH